MRTPLSPTTRFALVWWLAASLLGCAASPAAAPRTMAPPDADPRLELQRLTGEAALAPAELRVTVVDRSTTRLRTQALPSAWNQANLRLVSNANFGSRLTADRKVTLPTSAFAANSGSCGTTATACQVSTALFTKLRPGSYLFQISLDNTTTSPTTTVAVQSVSVTLTGGATTNMVVTLKTTGTGSNAITVTSTGTEAYSGGTPATGDLSNATSHAAVDFALVQGVTISLSSPLAAGDLAANTQATEPNVNATSPTNGTASFSSGQVSRVVASLRAGTTATVTTNVPQSDEKIVAVWYASGSEARTNTAWSSFYGGANDLAGIVNNVSASGAVVVSASLTNAATGVTVPNSGAANSGPNGAGVPGLTLVTSEAGTSADQNAVLIYRFYDNTYEHRYIGARTKSVVIDSPATLQATIN